MSIVSLVIPCSLIAFQSEIRFYSASGKHTQSFCLVSIHYCRLTEVFFNYRIVRSLEGALTAHSDSKGLVAAA